MFKLHGCRRCKGALMLEKDEFGSYEVCMQCGYSHDLSVDIPLDIPQMEDSLLMSVSTDTRRPLGKWQLGRGHAN